jgi:membrane-bound lytic murein transglycosylase F
MQKYLFLFIFATIFVFLYRICMMKKFLLIIFPLFLLAGCSNRQAPEITPWGTVVGGSGTSAETSPGRRFSLDDIMNNGEMIMLTLSGPESYYDYHGKGMGLQYLLCDQFAQNLGVSLRVEVCKDTTDMIRQLAEGNGDVIAVPLSRNLPEKIKKDLLFCGVSMDSAKTQWAVNKDNKELADSLNHWFKPEMIAKTKREENFLLSTRSIVRHVYSPMLNPTAGIISRYDGYFQMFAPMARIDWRLMAAQCYQESCFDPNAHSWAGAEGLMQIMPSTASHLGLDMGQLHDPEANVAAAAKYMAELGGRFSDIPDPAERCYYVLASYNGGYQHIRDAMALASKFGRNPYSWGNVSEFVLNLTMPQFYNDPVVKHGYMRGDETVDYVNRIRSRWSEYRGVARGKGFSPGGFGIMTPHRSRHRNRFR